MRKQLFIILLILVPIFSEAQAQTNNVDYSKVLKWELGDKSFLKLGFGEQMWFRWAELNDGTLGLNGEELDSYSELMLRRTYTNLYANVDRWTFFAMFAMTTQTFNNSINSASPKGLTFFVYDAWGSYQIHKKHLTLGAGLNLYNGLTRFSSSSSSKSLGADVETIFFPKLITAGQIGRQLGVFATGKFGKFDYRVQMVSPFRSDRVPAMPDSNVAYDYLNDNMGFKGYFQYQFFDQESNRTPFYTATYLGKKKIFNIGAGFDYQNSATISFDNLAQHFHNSTHFAADIFLDLPLKKSSAITFYAAYLNFNYGPNYILNYGVADNYSGLQEPQQGTGYALNASIAYLLPFKIKESQQIQVFYINTTRDFDALDNLAIRHGVGLNYYVIAQNLKFTAEYQMRPYFDGAEFKQYKSAVIGKMQFQF